MQSNDAMEVVAPLGGGISEVARLPDAAAVFAGISGALVKPGRSFRAAGRHLSSLESDVALFVMRVEIPVIGRDDGIAGVLCRNSTLTSSSRSTPLTQDQDTAVIGETTKTVLHDITNLLATIDCVLRLLERQTEVVDRILRSVQRGSVSSRKLLGGNWSQQNGHRDITTRRDLVAAAEDSRRAVSLGR